MSTSPILARKLLYLLQSVNGGFVSEEMLIAVVWRERVAPFDVWNSVRCCMCQFLRDVYGVRIEARSAVGTRFYRIAPEVA